MKAIFMRAWAYDEGVNENFLIDIKYSDTCKCEGASESNDDWQNVFKITYPIINFPTHQEEKTVQFEINGQKYELYIVAVPLTIALIKWWVFCVHLRKITCDGKKIVIGWWNINFQIDIWLIVGASGMCWTFYDCDDCCCEESEGENGKNGKSGGKSGIKHCNTKEQAVELYNCIQGSLIFNQLLKDYLTTSARQNEQFPKESE